MFLLRDFLWGYLSEAWMDGHGFCVGTVCERELYKGESGVV